MFKARARFVLSVLSLTAVLLTACDRASVVYVDARGLYTDETVERVYDRVEDSDIWQMSDPDVQELRHQALTSLRAEGDRGIDAANLVTSTFPPDINGVPLYVEWAQFGGTEALVLVEATGPADAQLNTLRIWVLSRSGDVLHTDWRN